MTRLPTPGGDDGNWGTILNDYLSQSHNTDGSIKSGAVGSGALANGSVTQPKLGTNNAPAPGQVLGYDGANLTWSTLPPGGISYNFRSISANASAAHLDFILVVAVPATVTITLPNPTANGFVRVKRLAAAGNTLQVVAPFGSYIDDVSAGPDLIFEQYQSSDYVSDGSNWYRV